MTIEGKYLMDDAIGNIISSLEARSLQQGAASKADLAPIDATIATLKAQALSDSVEEISCDNLLERVFNIKLDDEDCEGIKALRKVEDMLHCRKFLALAEKRKAEEEEIEFLIYDDEIKTELKHISDVVLRIKMACEFFAKERDAGTIDEESLKDILDVIPMDYKEVNSVDEEGNTPLYVFVSEGNKNVVENLLTYGAKVDIPNKDDEMPLTVAIRNKRVDIIKLLLFEGTELAVSEDELKILKNILPFDLFENFFGRELISQNLLIPVLLHYIRLRRDVAPEKEIEVKGVCYGLTLLYGYYQFLDEEDAFWKRISGAISTDPESSRPLAGMRHDMLTKREKELERLCNDVFYLQLPLTEERQTRPIETLSFLSDRQEIRSLSSQLYFAATFPKNAKTKEYEGLVKTLDTILSVDVEKPKFLEISTGEHAVGIFCREGKCFFYDPNSCYRQRPINISESNRESGVRALVKRLAAETFPEQDRITLGMEVIAQEDMPIIKAEAAKLYHEADIELNDSSDHTSPISIAKQNNRLDVVRKLVVAGAKIQDEDRQYVFDTAMKNGDIELFDALLSLQDNREDVFSDPFLSKPLTWAVETGHLGMVEHLIQKGFDVNEKFMGETPLDTAVRKGDEIMVKALLDAGAKADPPETEATTPLFFAVANGHMKIVSDLLAKGADVNRTVFGRTILALALSKGHTEIADLLRAAGAKSVTSDQ
ncbi:MAG: ankyrin repeat domain-containing protein [Waddliaceae bacterium]|jgi:ankyrin repeat protein|nr:ankyrin repeat domain-containing protein [Waddliaceae bacterium]